MQAIDGVDLSSPGAPSLVLRDLSEYATLPFLASFDIPPRVSATSATPSKSAMGRVTYIALSKKIMPVLVELFLRFKSQAAIYADGTVERICSVSIRTRQLLDCAEMIFHSGLCDPNQA